ncbi:Co/Zn/Cd cation efflux transporter, CDF family [Magnetospirillum sp. XM-1]|uniref:cation diffusion facilitator family transporter n=1 Tax=Magnetospirillum sp. XM-1 TaxID=1663591 RepID=UPI00073E1007|nr:cation diffusion facilitator family transporter [Magnetospirillum sp. XM-1]CUW37855.1 Co/Zn/Cd cation efflux transporter, CDF family [Magnetospirillum sp. XM-1]
MSGHHHHHHDHDHGHAHAPARHDRAFAVGIALNLGFVGLEAWWGVAANSLALLADAGHNLSDVLALVLAWAASILERRAASHRRTYGLGRATIWASLINALALLVAVGGIGWEALGRFSHPQSVEGGVVMAVATLGIIINTGTALMFMKGAAGDLNVRGAFLHMAGDAAVSAAVVVAALLIGLTGWWWLDPAISLGIAVIIAWSSLSLLKESVNLSLDAVPAAIDLDAVERFLAGREGVGGLHDLHVWPLSTSRAALTVHLVMERMPDSDEFLHHLAEELEHRFGIGHATIQLERGDGGRDCRLAAAHGP